MAKKESLKLCGVMKVTARPDTLSGLVVPVGDQAMIHLYWGGGGGAEIDHPIIHVI